MTSQSGRGTKEETEPISEVTPGAAFTGHAIDYQRKEWRIERIGWVVMALVIVAAFLGLFGGSGRFATATRASADGALSVTYPRINRYHSPETLRIEVQPSGIDQQQGEVRVWLDAAYARELGIQSILPEPDQVELQPDRITYVFKVAGPSAPVTIQIDFQQDRYWWQTGTVGLPNGESVSFNQVVFP